VEAVKGTVDFGILTIREDEFEAVLERMPPQATVKGRRTYNLHRMELVEGGSYLVAIVRCIEQGNTETLDATRDLLEELAPRWLLVVGIAGGVPSEEWSLGDVVVSTRIVDFRVEAVLPEGEPEQAIGGGTVDKEAAAVLANLPAMKVALGGWYEANAIGAARPPLVIEAERLYGDAQWQAKTRKALERHVGRTAPIVTAGVIASIDRQMKDRERLAGLLQAARNVIAVEMESAGAYHGASSRRVPFVAIRGLSDMVGLRREPEWTRYACHTAAAFMAAFLRTRPLEPCGGEGEPGAGEGSRVGGGRARMTAGATERSMDALVDELARVLADPDVARLVVQRAGLPAQFVPVFRLPLTFWAEVIDAAHVGRVSGGVAAVVNAVLQLFPSNRLLEGFMGEELRPRGESAAPPARPAKRNPSPPLEIAVRRSCSSLTVAELSAYREAVRLRHGVNRFIGFSSSFEYGVSWEELYVDLVMDKAHGHTKGELYANSDAEPEDESDEDLEAESERESQKLGLDDAFRYARDCNRRAMVLLGNPGSGKTTQLQQMLLRVLDEASGPESLGLPAGTLAVFVAIRDLRLPRLKHEDDEEPRLEELVRRALLEDLGGLSEDLVDRLLGHERLLLLLDGLDEVPDATKRARLARVIASAERRLSKHHLLVGSRYAGFADVKAHLGNAFLELRLRPLDDEQIERLVLNWHRAVDAMDAKVRPRKRSGTVEARVQAFLDRLRTPAIVAEGRLAELARTPLLLTALCLIHRERGATGGLPTDRSAIYEACEEILLGEWRRGAKGRETTLDAEAARRVLQPVAYWLHGEEKRRHATLAALRGPVAEGLRAVGKDGVSAEGFVRSFASESGLFTPWGPKLHGFIHLGFQEHLAALHVSERWSWEPKLVVDLVERFGIGWWREVTRMVLTNAEPELLAAFMTELVQHEEVEAWSRTRLLTECLRGARGEPSVVAPWVEVLLAPAGAVSVERRLAALRMLVQQVPAKAEELDALLREHPLEAVRGRWLGRTRIGRVATKVVAKAGVELVRIPGGWFSMGSAEDEEWSYDEGPQHEVELEEFWLARTPVTNAQYAEYLRANPNAKMPALWDDQRYDQSQQPVVGVSWEKAVAYCEWAGLRLPTEAQWEYACRAGTTTRYWSGDGEEDLALVGWYGGNSGGRLHAVGELEPNAFGLYDMHGNVREWCEDRWLNNYKGAVHRPGDGLRTQPLDTNSRVLRGGCFRDWTHAARSAFRGSRLLDVCGYDVGFRPAAVEVELTRVPGARQAGRARRKIAR